MTKKESTRGSKTDYPAEAARRFAPQSRVDSVRPFGSGNVNDTWLVSTGSDLDGRFILQRINRRVFPAPELIMQNLRTLTRHVSGRPRDVSFPKRRWEMPKVLSANDSSDYWIDPAGCFWRAMTFIEDSKSFNSVLNHEHATEVGFALGLFHSLVSDLPAGTLSDTLKGFHVTPIYLERYRAVRAKSRAPSSPDTAFCDDFIEKREAFASVLENARTDGTLPVRIIHGDPKVSNVLIDNRTGLAVSLVDLDTVKPGLLHYDMGDCLRSCCNPLGEDPADPDTVRFEPDLCRAVLNGWFTAAGELLNARDRDLIYDSIRLISYELGLRFYTDYLEGNVYFKVKDDAQNLRRAIVQFRLTASIESQERDIRRIVTGHGHGRTRRNNRVKT